MRAARCLRAYLRAFLSAALRRASAAASSYAHATTRYRCRAAHCAPRRHDSASFHLENSLWAVKRCCSKISEKSMNERSERWPLSMQHRRGWTSFCLARRNICRHNSSRIVAQARGWAAESSYLRYASYHCRSPRLVRWRDRHLSAWRLRQPHAHARTDMRCRLYALLQRITRCCALLLPPCSSARIGRFTHCAQPRSARRRRCRASRGAFVCRRALRTLPYIVLLLAFALGAHNAHVCRAIKTEAR